ncbi:MAG: DegT/DnrJ/EryC1/StrS family aminotransferase [Lachnospiraceae bacterium]|nr:DegT/DnrJ/EryC1/StrS family aminotransferase [Lachnospiraceae bacterium]
MELTPFKDKIYLSSPTMHGDELKYMKEAYDTNWMSTVGANINELEKQIADKIGVRYAVALSSGTSSLHLAVRFAGEKLYGKTEGGYGTLRGRKVFCSDMTFAATVNPIVYEGGIPVYIDSEYKTWNMDPEALKEAFKRFPEVRLIVVAHLYGTPGQIDEIKAIADAHDAIIVEDAAESFGATYKGVQTGSFGDYNCISFNGNKIITGTSGGMFLTDDEEAASKIRKWSTQSREAAPWYQHEDLGYNYRMSNVIAGVARGQVPYLSEHIAQKKAIYERYKEGFKDLPVEMNPFDDEISVPNYWLSCITVNADAMCAQTRTALGYEYKSEPGKSCPSEILETIASLNAEGRPIWKPMHMQPIYSGCDFVSAGDRAVCEDIFERGLCLPSDNKMSEEAQKVIIEAVRKSFE